MTGTASTRWRAWPLFIRIDARRPASWLALLAAAASGWVDHPVLAAAVAALATVAAAGDPPAAADGRPNTAWLAARAIWPVAGIALSVMAAQTWIVPAVGLTAVVATAITLGLVGGHRLRAADAASLTLAIVAAAVVCGLQAAAVGGPSLLVAGGVWLALAVAAARYARLAAATGTSTSLPRGAIDTLARGGLPIHAATRRLLGRMAMLTTLAAMVGWLLLDPGRWSLALTLAVAWFVCLAVPAALLQQGAATSLWEPLMRSAAGPPGRRFRWRRGASRTAADVAVAHAAVLGWPALVAAAVTAPTGNWRSLAVVLGLGVAAVAVAAVGWACCRRRTEPETAQAVALVAAAAILVGLGTHASVEPTARPPRLPVPPFLVPGKADVEQSAATCQTRQFMQFTAASRSERLA